MAEVLELAQLAEHDRVAEVDVGSGGVDPELDAQGTPGLRSGGELGREGAAREALDGVPGEVRSGVVGRNGRFRHEGPMLDSPRPWGLVPPGPRARRLAPALAGLSAVCPRAATTS